jgi:hypothetical protein
MDADAEVDIINAGSKARAETSKELNKLVAQVSKEVAFAAEVLDKAAKRDGEKNHKDTIPLLRKRFSVLKMLMARLGPQVSVGTHPTSPRALLNIAIIIYYFRLAPQTCIAPATSTSNPNITRFIQSLGGCSAVRPGLHKLRHQHSGRRTSGQIRGDAGNEFLFWLRAAASTGQQACCR